MEEHDLTLLRPLDIKAAVEGEPICTVNGNHLDFVAADEVNGLHCVRIGDWDSRVGRLSIWCKEQLRMAPIRWFERKPVYLGDVLYSEQGKGTIIKDCRFTGGYAIKFDGGKTVSTEAPYFSDELSWTRPNVKREGWVNIYGNGSACWRYHTKEDADNSARIGGGIIDPARIACVRIEWEEPA